MKRYAIWNKQDPILTPVGEVFTAEQWIARYPIAALDSITVICGAGEINGSYFGTLGQMVQMYEAQGCDFSACTTAQEKLDAIEAFDEAREAAARAAAEAAQAEETDLAEREVAALEAIASGQTTEGAAALNALLMGEE
jgi:RPA family protein